MLILARRGKTVIGAGEREQTRLMQESGRVGVGQRLQAGQALSAETRATGETALRGGQALGARLSEYERDLHRYVQRLEGMLPICAFCKSIRDQAGAWVPLETFIAERSDAEFTHSVCPSCGRTHYPNVDYDDAGPDHTLGSNPESVEE